MWRSGEKTGRVTYRVWAVDDLDNVLDMNVVLLRVQSQGRAVVLPAVDRLVAHRQHLPMHVQHLQDTSAFTARKQSVCPLRKHIDSSKRRQSGR